MKNFEFEITLSAETEEQALEKLEAFQKMDAALAHQDFIEVADFIETSPNTVALIQAELPKVRDLNGVQLAMQAPALLTKINEAQKKDAALNG